MGFLLGRIHAGLGNLPCFSFEFLEVYHDTAAAAG